MEEVRRLKIENRINALNIPLKRQEIEKVCLENEEKRVDLEAQKK
jgi:hypothetical protein